MSAPALGMFAIQRSSLVASVGAISALAIYLGADYGVASALLAAIGACLGFVLFHGALGFTGAYRKLFADREISGVVAQLAMLALATLLFAPVLATGEAFGRSVGGAVAPVSVSSLFGAFIFGIGMQLGGGCASGTLFATGGGSRRMLVVLVFFCLGGFWATLHMGWWRSLPSFGSAVLGEEIGWAGAVVLQLVVLGTIYAFLRAVGGRLDRSLWRREGRSLRFLLTGPWPMLWAALLLAVLNWATLVIAGHPWFITWGFTLWAAKAAAFLGWDPAASDFWRDGFPQYALTRPVLSDTTTVMNIGIVIGACAAASLAGKLAHGGQIAWHGVLSAVAGGILLGYGARLAYGCNIGAFFSGVASTSLHGWSWIVAALAGNAVALGIFRSTRKQLDRARTRL